MNERITPEGQVPLKSNEVIVYGNTRDDDKGMFRNSYTIQNNTSLEDVEKNILEFIEFAKKEDYLTFKVMDVSKEGLYTPEQLAPMFKSAILVKNIHLTQDYWGILAKST